MEGVKKIAIKKRKQKEGEKKRYGRAKSRNGRTRLVVDGLCMSSCLPIYSSWVSLVSASFLPN